ncbi:MAG: hypothetical protein ACE147_14960 [Candidatus Methylomirabilales bacterium]
MAEVERAGRNVPAGIDREMAEGGLQLDQDLRFTARAWRFERAAWTAMAVVILAALAGVTGGGWLSRAKVEAPGLAAEYERFLRYQTATSLLVTLRRERPEETSLDLVVDPQLLRGFKVRQVFPEPQATTQEHGGTRYAFPLTASEQDVTVRLELEPDRPGMQETRLARPGRQPARLRQFVWP